jgi:hypothetical protein
MLSLTRDQCTALTLVGQTYFLAANKTQVMEHEVRGNDIIDGMVTRIVRGMALALIIALSACQGSQELPTLAPTVAPVAQPPTPSSTSVPLTNTPAPPTVTPTPSATPVVLTPKPTSLAGPGINITTPSAGSELLLGQEVVVGGFVQVETGQEFWLALVSSTGHVLDQTQPEVGEFNSWQATLTIPQSVSGQAEFQARLVGQDGALVASDSLAVTLRVDPESVDRYLILDRPKPGEEAVAGFNIFFDGLAQQPVDNVVRISLWDEACQRRVAQQGFTLRGSGYWQGFVVVPANVSGQLCAVAHFGEPGSDTWREAQVQINVLPPDDERALGVLVGNPPADKELTPGTSLLLYGTAYNAPGREVLVSILLENGRLLNEGVTVADIYGYWELELFIPADADGPAQIEASVGERGGDQFSQSTVPVYIGRR